MTTATTGCRALIVSAALLAACSAVQAQAFDAVRIFGPVEGDGAGTVGAVVIAAPRYLGSDERGWLVLPSIDYRWKNGWFAGLSNGIGYVFPSRPDMQMGLRVTADLGRNESRSDALAGMGSVHPRPEAGAFFNYFPSAETFVTTSLRYGAGNDHDGMQIDLGAGYTTPLTQQLRGTIGVAATYVNGAYMQAYYGVTPQQSTASGYPVYSVGAGWRDVRLNASLVYAIDARWFLTGALTVASLQSGARDSPIVFEPTAVNGIVALSYGF